MAVSIGPSNFEVSCVLITASARGFRGQITEHETKHGTRHAHAPHLWKQTHAAQMATHTEIPMSLRRCRSNTAQAARTERRESAQVGTREHQHEPGWEGEITHAQHSRSTHTCGELGLGVGLLHRIGQRDQVHKLIALGQQPLCGGRQPSGGAGGEVYRCIAKRGHGPDV